MNGKFSPGQNSSTKNKIKSDSTEEYNPPESSNTNKTIKTNPATKKEIPNSNRYQSNFVKTTQSNKSKISLNSNQKSIIELPQIDFNYKNPNNLYFTKFIPKKNLFYFFIKETNEPTLREIRKRDTNQFNLYDANDIQRYKYYPGTHQIFTFIGFSNSNSREEAKSAKRLRYSSYKELIFNYPYKKEDESDIFTPNKDLYYFYDIEHRTNFGRIHCTNTKIFKIECQDLQRGYKLNTDDSNIYRFFGFTDRQTRNAMLKKLYDHVIRCSSRDFLSTNHFYYLHEEDKEDERDFIEQIKKEEEEKRKEKIGKGDECEKSDPKDVINVDDKEEKDDENDQKEIDDDVYEENDPKDGIDYGDDENDQKKIDDDEYDENDPKNGIEFDNDDDDDECEENDPKNGIEFDNDDDDECEENDPKNGIVFDNDDDDDECEENDPNEGLDFD